MSTKKVPNKATSEQSAAIDIAPRPAQSAAKPQAGSPLQRIFQFGSAGSLAKLAQNQNQTSRPSSKSVPAPSSASFSSSPRSYDNQAIENAKKHASEKTSKSSKGDSEKHGKKHGSIGHHRGGSVRDSGAQGGHGPQ